MELFLQTFARDPGYDATTGNTTDALDELSLEESQVYKQKVSKWIKNAIQSTGDPCFWFCMLCANTTRSPLRHFYHGLCAKEDSTRMPIVEFVAYRLEAIRRDFNNLLETFFKWSTTTLNFATCTDEMGVPKFKFGKHTDVSNPSNNVPSQVVEHVELQTDNGLVDGPTSIPTESIMYETAVALLVLSASAFDRRVTRVFRRHGLWPYGGMCWTVLRGYVVVQCCKLVTT